MLNPYKWYLKTPNESLTTGAIHNELAVHLKAGGIDVRDLAPRRHAWRPAWRRYGTP